MKKLLMLLAVVAMLAISLPAYGKKGDEPAKWCECEPQVLVYKTSMKGKIDDFNDCSYGKLSVRGYLIVVVDCNELAWADCGEQVEALWADHIIYGKGCYTHRFLFNGRGKGKYQCTQWDGGISFYKVGNQFAVHYEDDCWWGNAALNGKFKRTTLCKTRRGACPGCPCYCDVARTLKGGIKFWDPDCEILGWATMTARLDKKWTKRANCTVDPCNGDAPCDEIFIDIWDYLEGKGYESEDCCCLGP